MRADLAVPIEGKSDIPRPGSAGEAAAREPPRPQGAHRTFPRRRLAMISGAGRRNCTRIPPGSRPHSLLPGWGPEPPAAVADRLCLHRHPSDRRLAPVQFLAQCQ